MIWSAPARNGRRARGNDELATHGDELEKALSGSGGGEHDGGTATRVFGILLTWMSEKTAPVFVFATANNVSALPSELMRKGRFDELFFTDLPGFETRQDILAIHIRKRKRNPDAFDLAALSKLSATFSGAELEQVVISALHDAFDAERDLQQEDMISAIERTVPLAKTMKERIDSLRDWAKTRAVAASSCEPEVVSMADYMD